MQHNTRRRTPKRILKNQLCIIYPSHRLHPPTYLSLHHGSLLHKHVYTAYPRRRQIHTMDVDQWFNENLIFARELACRAFLARARVNSAPRKMCTNTRSRTLPSTNLWRARSRTSYDHFNPTGMMRNYEILERSQHVACTCGCTRELGRR